MKKVALYSRSGRTRRSERSAARSVSRQCRDGDGAADRAPAPAGRSRWRTRGLALRTCTASRRRRPVRARPGLGPCGVYAGACDAHPEGNRRRRPVHAGERPDAVARGQVVRGRAAVSRAGARPHRTTSAEDGYQTEGVGTGVVIVDTGHHPDQPARRQRRRPGAGRVLRRASNPKPSSSACDRSTISRCCRRRSCPTISRPRRCARPTTSRSGDEVIAVGFPFGIGPSVSAGVISGLHREYRSPARQAASSPT